MKVQGLNNQGFQQTAKASPAGKSSQGKGTSFESLLGQADITWSVLDQKYFDVIFHYRSPSFFLPAK